VGGAEEILAVGKPIFVGGTSSHAGKSWMTTAICAWLRRRGVRVAPFKAQNMSNNSYPCRAGGEIGRAQAAQAWACGLEPESAMNPILLKPNSDGGSQVVVHGKVWKTLPVRAYYDEFDFLLKEVMQAYEELASRFDVIVMEGAGSVTELNLRQFDLVNLGLVTRLSAPWLLVADIERGGVFASVTGTVGLLSAEERALMRAFAINKFRGDLSLFEDGKRILEERTGSPCLGVFPYAEGIDLDDEDSLSIPMSSAASPMPVGQRHAIVRFPRISNTTDFRLLKNATWITAPTDQHFDFIFLPGSKNTIADLDWLKRQGLAEWIGAEHRRGATVIGICGGYQMLGERIRDPYAMESGCGETYGLGLLPIETELRREKTTRVVGAQTRGGHAFSAYEIHLGETTMLCRDPAAFALLDDGTREGMRHGTVIGTYLHGALEDAGVLAELGIAATPDSGRAYDLLADWFAPSGKMFEELFLQL
jgi:adenosylcobyric acid synthase